MPSVVCLAEVTVHIAACELGVHVPVSRVQQRVVREHHPPRWGDHGHSGRILCTLCRVPPNLTAIQCRFQIELTRLLPYTVLRSSSGNALVVTVDLPVDDQVTGSYGAATSVITESRLPDAGFQKACLREAPPSDRRPQRPFITTPALAMRCKRTHASVGDSPSSRRCIQPVYLL